MLQQELHHSSVLRIRARNYNASLKLSKTNVKGDSNPNNKYFLSERALWTMNFDAGIIKIGWKMGKLSAFKEFNMANI